MAGEQEIENDDIDDVAQKAAEIGEAIGVEKKDLPKGKDDDAPDYEIEEEGDERIAKEREPRPGEGGDRKKTTAKEKRDAKKRAVERKLNEKDGEINQLRSETEELRAWRAQVEGRLANVDKGKVDEGMNKAAADYNAAAAEYETAFTEGDGAKARTATEKMFNSKQAYDQLKGIKAQLDKPAPANNAPNPRIINKAKAWAAKHDWYDASGTDEDSEIAKSLSQVLANEGLDPSTDKFWTELDKRLIKRGVIDADESGDYEDDYEDDEPVAKKPKKRGSPPVSGGSNRGGDGTGKIKISLPTHYVNTLKAEGIWDDVPRRNRVIKGYLAARREAAQQ